MSSDSPPPTLPALPLLFFSVMSSSPLFLLFFLLPAFGPGIAEAQLGPSQRSSSIFERVKEPTCRPVDVGLCRSVPYNRTIFPNPFVDLDLASLQAQTEHFKPLIRTQCSPHILFFVCSVFAPMCPEQMPQAVTSCRSVCEEVQRDCLQIFRDFDFPWPPVLNCSRFPSPPALCMRPEPSSAPVAQPPPPSPRLPECPQDLVDLEPTEPSGKCAPRCEKTTMFRKDRKEQARLWLLCWALLNALVALFTVCSFGIDLQRFCFPERSVCFLALCSLLSTLPHLWRPLMGFDSMACGQLPSGAKFLLLEESAQESRPCLVSFALAYYFSLAGSCWWLALGFTWYLSAARKWVEEELNKRSLLLHLLAWGLPALLAAAALAGHRVDASELTGICTLGNSDPLALLWLWLVPKLGLTLLGLFLLLAGFSAMCKERHSFRRRGTDTSRLEKFLLKMGTFTALYVLSALVASLCDLHHLTILAQWHPNTIGCKALGGAFSGQCVRPEQPAPEPYILGQTMALAAGIASGLWIFSPKTLISWRRALFCCWPSQPKLPVGRQGQMALQHHQTMALLTDPPAAPQAVSGYVRPPPSQRPPLSSLPSLPPPPPTAVPSSAYGSSSHFLPSQQQHQQRQNYIPLSILTSTQSAGRSANELVYQNPFQQAADL